MHHNIEARGYDFHCHLDLFRDRESVRRDLEDSQIVTFAMTTTPRAFEQNLAIFGTSPYVRVGLGLHPELAVTREADVATFVKHLRVSRVVGEIGLDGRPQYAATLPKQIVLLRELLKLSNVGPDKVYSFHSVRAVSKVLDCIETDLDNDRHVKILHWFTGSKGDLRRAVSLNCFFSLNRAMLSKAGANNLLSGIPLDRLLTETDGPFIARGARPSRPSDVLEIPALLSANLGVDLSFILQQLAANAKLVDATIAS